MKLGKATSESPAENVVSVKDQIVRRLIKVGSACAPDLANSIRPLRPGRELISTLESMVEEGILRVKVEQKTAEQKVYEIAR